MATKLNRDLYYSADYDDVARDRLLRWMLHCFDGCELPVEGECWTTPQMLAREVLRGNLDVARALCDWVLETDFSPTARIPPPYYVTALEDCVRELKRLHVEWMRSAATKYDGRSQDGYHTLFKDDLANLQVMFWKLEREAAACGRPGL